MVLLFDLNGTLLDTAALAKPLAHIFGRKLDPQGFFDQLLKYSMALTLAGSYRDFSEVASAVLDMEAASYGIKPSGKEKAAVLDRMRRLPPFPEVAAALHRLKNSHYRLAVLTNSNPAAMESQLRHSGLARYFEKTFSVEAVRRYKPAPEVYQYAARALEAEPKDIVMVAAHAWDLLGAAAQGFQTALLTRLGHAAFPGTARPNLVAPDLANLADQLLGTAPEPPPPTPVPSNYPLVGSLLMTLGLATVLWPTFNIELDARLAQRP